MYRHHIREEKQRGGIMVFFAIAMTALMMVLAMAIDLNMAAVSREQAQHHARFAALAALEEYYDTRWCHANGEPDPQGLSRLPCSPAAKYDAAIKRVNDVFRSNSIVGTADQAEEIVAPGADPTGERPVLIPGLWHPKRKQADQTTAVCGDLPCFEPLEYPLANSTGINTVHPNAFKVTGNLYRNLTMRIGRKLLGYDQMPMHTEAVGTLVPRRGCFLVDLSPSIVRPTHHLWQFVPYAYRLWLKGDYPSSAPAFPPTDGFGYEFAFELNYCGFADPVVEGASILANQCLPADAMTIHDMRFDVLLRTHPLRAVNDPVRVDEHYASDYVSKIVLSDQNYSAYALRHLNPNPFEPQAPNNTLGNYHMGSLNTRYEVDLFFMQEAAIANNVYRGPEPLRSVILGLRHALQQFRDRRVPGDMACVIFYDESLRWPRVFNLTEDIESLIQFTHFDDRDENGSRFRAGNIPEDPAGQSAAVGADGNPPMGLERILRHNLFPRRDAKTNTLKAVIEAVNQFGYYDKVGIPSKNFVVLIGDGKNNCRNCTSGCTSCPMGETCVEGCSNDYPSYHQSTEELKDYVRRLEDLTDIPFHIMLLGEDVMPHTKPLRGAEGGCLSGEEVRAAGLVPVDGGVIIGDRYYENPDDQQYTKVLRGIYDNSYFLQVNKDLYEIAVMSGGTFSPVRPQRGTAQSCSESNCGAPGTRQTTDPYCRSEGEQIRDIISEIMGDNPIRLAEVK